MSEVRLAHYGLDGHQLFHKARDLSRVRLVGAGGLTKAQGAMAREKQPDVPLYDDLDTLMERSDPDLIVFCHTPRTEQTELVIRALKARKHVLVEKPMAVSMPDLDRLREAAAEAGTVVRTMTMMPYSGDFTAMRRIIASGALGSIVQIYAMKSYPYTDGRPQDRRVDGGLIEQAGIHAISFIRYVTGLEFAEVFAQDTGVGNPKKGDLQLGATLSFRMNSGALAAVLCNYCNPRGVGYHGNDHLRIHGANGFIELVDGRQRRGVALGEESPRSFEDVAPGREYPQDIIDCILDGTPTLLSQEDSFRNTEVVVRAQESAQTGKVIRL